MSRGSVALAYRPLDMLETRDGTPANKDARMTNVILEAHASEPAFIKRAGYASALTGTGSPYGATAILGSNNTEMVLSVNGSTANISQSVASSTWTILGSNVQIKNVSSSTFQGIVSYNCFSYNGFLFGIIANPGSNAQIVRSTNGTDWTVTNTAAPIPDTTNYGVSMFQFLGSMYIIQIGTGNVYSSSGDLSSWTNLGALSGIDGSYSLFITPTKLYAVRSNGLVTKQSTNGFTFTSTGNNCSGLGGGGNPFYFNSTYMLVDPTNKTVYSSANGFTWSLLTNLPSGFVSVTQYAALIHKNNLVILGGTGTPNQSGLWYSADGANWYQSYSNTTPSGVLTGKLSNNGATQVANVTSYNGYLYRLGTQQGVINNNAVYYDFNTPGGVINFNAVASVSIPSFTSGQTATGTNYYPYDPLDFSQTFDQTKVAMKNRLGAWQLTVSGNSIVQVTDSDYPTVTARGIAYLDGTFYVMDTHGTIYGSGINDFTTWTALNVISAQSEPDGGVAITKYMQYVVAFGNYTTEFFYDAGNATGSPLSPVQNGQLLIGCSCADSVAQLEKTVFFVSQRKVQGQATGRGFSVSKIEGFNATDISTPDIERILNADGLYGAWATTINILGHDGYLLNLPTSNLSLFYDADSKLWSFMTHQYPIATQTFVSTALTCAAAAVGLTTGTVTAILNNHGFSDGDPVTIAGATPSDYNGTFNITYVDGSTFTYPSSTILSSPATGTITAVGYMPNYFPLMMAFEYLNVQVFQSPDGNLYQFGDTLYADNGVYIDTHIRTSRKGKGLKDDENQQSKFCSWVDVVTDRISANALLRYTDNDYQSYSKYRSVSLSAARSRINRLGRFIRRAWELRHTDQSAFRLQYLELGLEQGDE